MHKLFTLYRLWLILLALSIGLLVVLSSLPRGTQDFSFVFADKIIHFGYFMGISGLLNLYWSSFHRSSYVSLGWFSVVIVAILGALDEWYQTYRPGRSGNDLGDWLADCAGAVVGYLIIRFIYQYTYK